MIWLALLACGGPEPQNTAENFADFAGAFGMSLEFVPSEATDSTPMLLEVSEDGALWETRLGTRWADAQPLDTLAVTRDAGLWVEESQLLPGKIAVGLVGEGVEILALEAHTVYYGTFEETVLVEVESGRFAGQQVFARTLGPIRLTLDGAVWELAFYE